ncbi:hypothetical protein KAT95_01265 [Candidatus Parcubacteria bacterium]|nr:hypothetical protein [Candidatus Parcubacteria bacterium]
MDTLEFQFNPKIKKEKICDSFCYEPENEQEEKLGNLYIVAEIQDTAINASQLLNDLASVIKQEYYSDSSQTPEKNFKKALKKANEFLLRKAGEYGDIELLEKINLAVFAISNQWQIHLSKKGNIKAIISREKEIQEISQKPSRTIENITSGELLQNDKAMVFTEQVLDFFEDNNLIEKISSVQKKKEINKLLKEHKKALSKISGIFLLIILRPSAVKIFKRNAFQKSFNLNLLTKLKKPSFGKINSILIFFKSIIAFLIALPEKIRKTPQRISEAWKEFKAKFRTVIFSKKLILVFLLILILAVGSMIFKNEKDKKIQMANQSLEEIKEKIEQAENFLIFKDEEKANILLLEARKNTISLTETRFILKDEALVLKESIEEQLYILNKIEEIKEPLLSNDFEEKDFGAEEIIYRSKVYSLNPAAGEIIKQGKIWGKSEKLINARAMAIDGSIWIINKDNKIDRYYAGKWQETLELNIFPDIEKLEKIHTSPALSYIYLLEPEEKRVIIINKTGDIIKQFFSEKFDNLKDFIVSENGKTIWLLNSSKVYQINL